MSKAEILTPYSDTPVVLIAFQNASLAKDIKFFISNTTLRPIEVLSPEIFLQQGSCEMYPHLVCVNKDMALREKIVDKINREGYQKFTYVDPRAAIIGDLDIGAGCFIGPFVTVASDSKIQEDCIVSPYCMISHRAVIGIGTVMQPHAMVAGTSTVGRYCKLNVKSTVLDNLSICNHVELGANALVTKNLSDPGFYLGSPARKKIM